MAINKSPVSTMDISPTLLMGISPPLAMVISPTLTVEVRPGRRMDNGSAFKKVISKPHYYANDPATTRGYYL